MVEETKKSVKEVMKEIESQKAPKYKSQKLGNINKKPIFCNQKCPHCPRLVGQHIQVQNILKNGKLANIVCKSQRDPKITS